MAINDVDSVLSDIDRVLADAGGSIKCALCGTVAPLNGRSRKRFCSEKCSRRFHVSKARASKIQKRAIVAAAPVPDLTDRLVLCLFDCASYMLRRQPEAGFFNVENIAEITEFKKRWSVLQD